MNAIQLDVARKIRKKKKTTRHHHHHCRHRHQHRRLVVVLVVNVRRVCVKDDGVVDNLLKENL